MKLCFFLIIFSFNFNFINCQIPISYQDNYVNSVVGNVQIGQILEIQPFILDSISGLACITFNPYKYGLSELNQIQVVGITKLLDDLSTGLKLKGNLSDIYKEISFSSNISYKINESIYFGITFNLNSIYIKDFNKFSQFNIDINSKIRIDDKISAGFKIENINRAKYDENKNVYQRFICGFDYKLNPLSFFEIDSRINFNQNSGLIFSYKSILTKELKLKVAYDTGYNDLEAVLLYNLKDFDFVFGTTFNSILGLKPRIELIFKW